MNAALEGGEVKEMNSLLELPEGTSLPDTWPSAR